MRQQYTFQILAPDPAQIGPAFLAWQCDGSKAHYLKGLQQLRGRIYRKDGAIRDSDLDAEGRFRMQGDDKAWHLVLVDRDQTVIGCARYLVHPETASFHDLRIGESPLARHPLWGKPVWRAVDADLKLARTHGLKYVEVGGWAVAEEWRGTRAALEIAIGSFALGILWGGAIGSCTATVRHGSASILRRLGGERLTAGNIEIPPYRDEIFDCEMELLRFDYRKPPGRYVPLVNDLARRFERSAVITNRVPIPNWAQVEPAWVQPRALLAAPHCC